MRERKTSKEVDAVDIDVMEVDAILADSVAASENKLYVQGGGWDTIFTQVVPFRQARLGLAMVLRIPWTATNQMHSFSIKIVDADGHNIALGQAPQRADAPGGKAYELKGQFNVGRPAILSPSESQVIPIAVNMDGLEFHQAANHSLIIEVDGTEMKRLPIRIRSTVQMPRPATPSLPG